MRVASMTTRGEYAKTLVNSTCTLCTSRVTCNCRYKGYTECKARVQAQAVDPSRQWILAVDPGYTYSPAVDPSPGPAGPSAGTSGAAGGGCTARREPCAASQPAAPATAPADLAHRAPRLRRQARRGRSSFSPSRLISTIDLEDVAVAATQPPGGFVSEEASHGRGLSFCETFDTHAQTWSTPPQSS